MRKTLREGEFFWEDSWLTQSSASILFQTEVFQLDENRATLSLAKEIHHVDLRIRRKQLVSLIVSLSEWHRYRWTRVNRSEKINFGLKLWELTILQMVKCNGHHINREVSTGRLFSKWTSNSLIFCFFFSVIFLTIQPSDICSVKQLRCAAIRIPHLIIRTLYKVSLKSVNCLLITYSMSINFSDQLFKRSIAESDGFIEEKNIDVTKNCSWIFHWSSLWFELRFT